MLTTTLAIEHEAQHMVNLILRELIVNFGKTKPQADRLLRKTKVYESLLESPQGLHDSPHTWALVVLTDNNEYEALDKYYFNS